MTRVSNAQKAAGTATSWSSRYAECLPSASRLLNSSLLSLVNRQLPPVLSQSSVDGRTHISYVAPDSCRPNHVNLHQCLFSTAQADLLIIPRTHLGS